MAGGRLLFPLQRLFFLYICWFSQSDIKLQEHCFYFIIISLVSRRREFLLYAFSSSPFVESNSSVLTQLSRVMV